jgi:hypothetical protein
MSEVPEMPNLVMRTLIVSRMLHDDCRCDTPHNLELEQKCSTCQIQQELRRCWPTEYLAVADVMLKRAQKQ